jgi:hypothetical protein
MVSVLALSAVDHGFESQSGQTKDYIIGKYAVLKRKREHNGWLGIRIMCASGTTLASIMQIQLSVFV